jgi:hypothetical protein
MDVDIGNYGLAPLQLVVDVYESEMETPKNLHPSTFSR